MDFWEWCGFPKEYKYENAKGFGRVVGFLISLFALILALLFFGTLVLFGKALFLQETNNDFAAVRNIGLVLATFIGAPFVVWRSIVAQKQADIAEQNLITDRINAAVASLGAEKVVKIEKVTKQKWGGETRQIVEETRPNIEVRVGAILALERLAQNNDSVHVQIMEILCSYLRANAPRREETRDWMAIFKENYKLPDAPWEQRPDLHVFQYNMPDHELPAELSPPREDIQMALHVIGRRGDDKIALEQVQSYRIDLRNCCFDRANLKNAKLQEANLSGAQLQGAYLIEAQLQEAYLSGAQLQGADLIEAQLQGADLSGAQLDASTDLTRTLLRLVRVRSVDFTDVTITDDQLQTMFGDGSVTIEDERRPAHWPKEVLEWEDFYKAYDAWKATYIKAHPELDLDQE